VVRMSAEARRAQLLQAALRVMARDGLAAGTTRAIVAEAGMSLATFHYCFRSRNELLRELIILVTTLERDAIRSAMLPGDDFRETLRRALHGYLEHLADNPGHELFLFELNHHALRTPVLRDLADEQYRRYYESAERLLTDAAELAGMTWQVELPVLARLVVIVIDGATTTWLVDQDTEGTVKALETVVDHLATLAAAGAGPSTRSR
jgi:TetR/AcrR family transcriptional regulator, regulator of biofilm formation and stress response